MGTGSRTWVFASDAEGMVAAFTGGARPTFDGWQSGSGNPAGCVQWTQTNNASSQSCPTFPKNPTDQNYINVFGLTGQVDRIVSGQLLGFDYNVLQNTALVSHTINFTALDAIGNATIALSGNVSLNTTISGWTSVGAQTLQPASRSPREAMRLSMNYTVTTNASANVVVQVDNIVVQVSYNAAPNLVTTPIIGAS